MGWARCCAFSSVASSIAASESESEWSCSCVGGGQRSAEGWGHEVWAGRIGTGEKVFSGRSSPAKSISAEVRVKESGKGGVGI